ncbi:type IV-A pilus assembly ATPase PilB [Salinicola rhizosphaerae]|uniref:Type 4 fimbrial assembly protein PilB n=1 Tax=Salinicola rhizosphaerae TaxID=1443141 RepID=A0ABQ3EDG7_9GAMM|nr:type IV-A pilus assembly ATPase PilB [Salinicola rhizosphaerae]GHB27392.1 type 4 fimbrial assembly protein PilB [Salinicola rhizosphaerae]
MSEVLPQRPLTGLARRFVEQQLIGAEACAQAEQAARAQEQTLLEYLVRGGKVDAREAGVLAAREYGLPFLDLAKVDWERLPIVEPVAEKVIRRFHVLPLARDERRLTVAIAFPATLARLDELQFTTGLAIEGVLVAFDQLEQALARRDRHQHTSGMLEALDEATESLTLDSTEVDLEREAAALDQGGEDDEPVVRFVNKILRDAIQRGASDIHFEPYEVSYRIRFRVDGMLLEIARPPLNLRTRLAARVKVMARLDISERRLPQDGAMKVRLDAKRAIDFRVNTLPTVFGEKIVLRLLDAQTASWGVDALGFSPPQRQLFEAALAEPQGMILVTGPTGSGKTVTLYTGINLLNTEERNISTAEDPVELKVPGVNQVNVQPRIGLDFASALRAFLRQDPDVVMVGEIRDLETAEIAVKAAQTGHLVLSTLHTNSAAETLTRLRNMGVASFNIASSVSLIIAQRLARLLCPRCKTPADIPADILLKEGVSPERLADATLYQAVGCDHCTLGYKGRVGLYEVVPVSDTMSQMIMGDSHALELAAQARQEGHPGLRQSGIEKVLQGLTSLEEINRVTTD